ncbi:helix-turn-helix transcriptional regulator [Litoribacter ruber]|uniref:helix-turn-helix domain-containing protein n=1 Tax=Litoribacter ruber TaxID=702568 RepID=UPI001BDAC83C|nr:helix-turn-helix transcriptional regulator [Litoribacter ruber]MBT0812368.1 helix-turn-helix transcriptional regulator [Litoribacter ruber]
MDIKEAFGKKIKSIRTEKGISQESLADLAFLDRTYISDIEKGKRNVSIETVQKLAVALEIEMKELFNYSSY